METRVTLVGPDTIVLETAVPESDTALSLTSTYLGCVGTETVISHACVSAGTPARSWSRRESEGLLPVSSHQERCLLDHMSELQEALRRLGRRAQIDLPEETLTVARNSPGD